MISHITQTTVNIKQPTIKIKLAKEQPKDKSKIQLATKIEGPENTVQYHSNQKEVATVDENGLVTTLKPGIVTITATANGVSDTYEIEVTLNDHLIKDVPLGKGISFSKGLVRKPQESIFGKHYKEATKLYENMKNGNQK